MLNKAQMHEQRRQMSDAANKCPRHASEYKSMLSVFDSFVVGSIFGKNDLLYSIQLCKTRVQYDCDAIYLCDASYINLHFMFLLRNILS